MGASAVSAGILFVPLATSADEAEMPALPELVRACIGATGMSGGMTEMMASRGFDTKLVASGRNGEGPVNVWDAETAAISVHEIPSNKTCTVRYGEGDGETNHQNVLDMIETWYGGTEPISSGRTNADTANRDIFCVDETDFGNGWFLVLTSL